MSLPFPLHGPPWVQVANRCPPGMAIPVFGQTPIGVSPPGTMPYEGGDVGYGTGGEPVVISNVQRVETDGPLEISLEVTEDNQLVNTTPGLRLYGFTAKETSGSAVAKAVIRRGSSTSAPVIAFLNLNADEAVGTIFSEGIRATEGLFFDLLSGAMSFVAYYKIVPER